MKINEITVNSNLREVRIETENYVFEIESNIELNELVPIKYINNEITDIIIHYFYDDSEQIIIKGIDNHISFVKDSVMAVVFHCENDKILAIYSKYKYFSIFDLKFTGLKKKQTWNA